MAAREYAPESWFLLRELNGVIAHETQTSRRALCALLKTYLAQARWQAHVPALLGGANGTGSGQGDAPHGQTERHAWSLLSYRGQEPRCGG